MNELECRELHRKQAADLILLDPDDNHLVFSSPVTVNDDRSMSFEVRQPIENGDRYKVTVKIEEV